MNKIIFGLFLLLPLFSLYTGNAQAQSCNSSIKIVSPANNTSYAYSSPGVNGTINVTFSSNCYSKPIQVVYTVNGQQACAIDDGDPTQYTCPITGLGVGNYSLQAVAWANGFIEATSNTVNISVVAPAPSVNLTINSNSYITPASIVMSATASTNGYGVISQIQFYADGNLLSTSYSSSATYTWTGGTAGVHTLMAKATNSTTGATATSTISNLPVYTPPNFIAYDAQCSAKL